MDEKLESNQQEFQIPHLQIYEAAAQDSQQASSATVLYAPPECLSEPSLLASFPGENRKEKAHIPV